MTTEQKLLVALLADTSEDETKPLLQKNIDWTSFVQTAESHRVIPLIFQKLRGASADLPSEMFEDLRNRAESCAARNLLHDSELFRIAGIFEENGIEFLFYKGATLARLAYNDSSLRQFGDLDVLIHKKDFPKIKRLLVKNGGKPAWNLSDKQEKAVLKHYYEFPFRFGERAVLVEAHWALMESFFGFDYDTKAVFRRSQTILLHGKKIRTFSNEDLLVYLCVHGAKHFWTRLSWICDVGKLVAAQPINWDFTIETAEKYGCLRMLNLGLFLAQDFLRIDLPGEIEAQINGDKEVKPLARRLQKHLFDDESLIERSSSAIHLKMRERRRDKFAYWRRLMATKLVDSLFMPMGRPQ